MKQHEAEDDERESIARRAPVPNDTRDVSGCAVDIVSIKRAMRVPVPDKRLDALASALVHGGSFRVSASLRGADEPHRSVAP